MAHDGWNSGAPSLWYTPQWQRPHGGLNSNNYSPSMDLGAIGSERKVGTKAPQSPGGNAPRPPSWQDEIGSSKPRSTRDIGPLKPYNLDNIGSKNAKSRSSSTPAAEAVKPKPFAKSSQLRHLSMSASEHDDSHEAARRTLRLTKSPTEFIPAAKRDTSNPTANVRADMQSSYHADIPAGQWGFQKYPSNFSPRAGATYGISEAIADSANDSEAYIPGHASQPNRDVNLRQLRSLETPPPRPGSADDDPQDLADLAQQVLSFNTEPALPPREQMVIPEELQEFWNRPENIMAERKRNLELFNTKTPMNLEEARKRGLGDHEFMLLQRRDLARRSVPSTTFPFLNGGQDINECLDDWPPEVGRAVLQPPPVVKNQFVVISFKHHRAEVFILPAQMPFVERLSYGDLVVVQADRGENVGSVWHIADSMMEAERIARDLNTEQLNHLLSFARTYAQQARSLAPLQSSYKLATQPGFIIRKAESRYAAALIQKEHDETKAKRIAATKAQETGFPLEILDTEFQIDHQKLTIYYISPEYVRFKELVNNIYKIYKMRIWMSSINPQHPPQDFFFQ